MTFDKHSHFGRILMSANAESIVNSNDKAVIFIDFSELTDRVEEIRNAFPNPATHTVAIKTNPLLKVLEHLVNIGAGLEAASIGELALALKAGAQQEMIVFDSPVKSLADIQYVRENCPNLTVNANCLAELELYEHLGWWPKLGLRINARLESSEKPYLNVSGEYSKFGVPIEQEDEILTACTKYPEIAGLHIHIGSQWDEIHTVINAIGSIVNLADRISDERKKNGQPALSFLDIGGGFPVKYKEMEPDFTMEYYAEQLAERYPSLFKNYQVITEFGRFIHAKSAWAVSDVEYILKGKEKDVLMIHLGADMFLREAYNPGDWYHELLVLDKDFNIITENKQIYDIGGPLCFGGDFLDLNRSIPESKPGDKLIICDVGANTFALWSRHCSRFFPKVIGYNSVKDLQFQILKEKESEKDILRFWV